MEPSAGRRLTTLDAMVLVGATALGLVGLPGAWPEAWEVFRVVDVGHLLEDSLSGRIFQARPRGGRMDSMGLMARSILRPFSGTRPARTGFLKPDGSRSTDAEWLDNFGAMRTNRASGGKAVGYAAAGEAYVLAFPFLIAWTIGLMALRSRRPRPGLGMLWRQPGWCGCVAGVAGVAAGLAEEAIVGWPVPTVLAPSAVVLAWLVLLVIRRWSAEASWVDRAGRCLGVAWMATIVLYVVGFVLPHIG